MPIHSKDGWQQSGTLTLGNRLKTVSMQANFPTAGFYTVQFGVVPPPIAAPFFGFFECFADLEWSVEGATVRRLVSVGNGMSVSGPGQAAKVTLRDVTDTILTADYTVSVQITPGTRPSVSRPPILRALTGVVVAPPGGTLLLPVPPDAGVISVEASYGAWSALPLPPSIASPVSVDHIGPGTITKSYFANVETGFVPVNPGTTFVSMLNLDPVVTFVFQLTWGIDG